MRETPSIVYSLYILYIHTYSLTFTQMFSFAMIFFRFSGLFQKYCDEVYPARLVFVSFLRHQHAQGQMVSELKGLGFDPLQFQLEGSRPDLSKLDNLFGLLSSDSATFDEELLATEQRVRSEGLAKVFDELKKELNENSED